MDISEKVQRDKGDNVRWIKEKVKQLAELLVGVGAVKEVLGKLVEILGVHASGLP